MDAGLRVDPICTPTVDIVQALLRGLRNKLVQVETTEFVA
jgi:hypothetical protein